MKSAVSWEPSYLAELEEDITKKILVNCSHKYNSHKKVGVRNVWNMRRNWLQERRTNWTWKKAEKGILMWRVSIKCLVKSKKSHLIYPSMKNRLLLMNNFTESMCWSPARRKWAMKKCCLVISRWAASRITWKIDYKL